MNNEAMGWLISLALLITAVSIRAMLTRTPRHQTKSD
jgi:hypothetical protein